MATQLTSQLAALAASAGLDKSKRPRGQPSLLYEPHRAADIGVDDIFDTATRGAAARLCTVQQGGSDKLASQLVLPPHLRALCLCVDDQFRTRFGLAEATRICYPQALPHVRRRAHAEPTTPALSQAPAAQASRRSARLMRASCPSNARSLHAPASTSSATRAPRSRRPSSPQASRASCTSSCRTSPPPLPPWR